jgi:hypothetical protein
MPYLYSEAESLAEKPTVGTKQCVALIKQYTNAPPTTMWKEGKAVKGNLLLAKGTAIATFVDGKYPNNGSGNHAAFYLGQDAVGIWVVDQWSTSKTIQSRRLTFKGRDKKTGKLNDPSNNGDAFSVIE